MPHQKFILIVSSILAVVVLVLFSYTLSTGKLPSIRMNWWPKKNAVVDKNINTQTTTTDISFAKEKPDGIAGRMYLFRKHQLLSYEPLMKTTEVISTFTDNVTEAVVSPNLDTYAYLATQDQHDTLYLRRRGLAKDVAVFTADHSYTGQDEVKSSSLRSPIRFSPDGRYLLIRQMFWEWCGDLLVNVATVKVVTTTPCEAIAWSADGKTVAIGNGYNYDGPISFSFGQISDIKNFHQVSWPAVGGDNADFLDDQKQPVWANAFIAFEDRDNILLLVSWTGTLTMQGSGLYRYTISNNSVHRLLTFPTQLNGVFTVVGSEAVIVNSTGRYLIDLKKKTYRRISDSITDPGQAFVQFFHGVNNHLLLATTDYDETARATTSITQQIDLADLTIGTLIDATDAQFAGWSPLNAPSRDLGFLHQDFKFADLPVAQKKTLDAQIENWSLYKSNPTMELGGLDCGSSPRHEQLQALNNTNKRSLKLNNGLTITITPNIFHWDAVEMNDFFNDDTVVCGVGTTTARVIAGEYLWWWDRCVGGAGIGQPGNPYFDESIRCVQAEDVIQRHFSLQ